jgi:hypothetical protein
MRVACFVRADVAPACHKWRSSAEATGIGHVLSNKGGVGVSCRVWDTSVCFINAHLAAHDDMERRRNDDFAEIVGGCGFGEKVECVHAFHHLVWFGDLNYRCEWGVPTTTTQMKKIDRNPPKERVQRMIEALSYGGDAFEDSENGSRIAERRRRATSLSFSRERFSVSDTETDPANGPRVSGFTRAISRRLAVFQTDQLTAARIRGDAFAGFEEGNPAKAHMPTFKVQREPGFRFQEQRTPAWCDRVLWKTAEGFRCDQTFLRAAGAIGTSDHKPVACGLSLEICAHASSVRLEDENEAEAGNTPRSGEGVSGSFTEKGTTTIRNGNERGSHHSNLNASRWENRSSSGGVSNDAFVEGIPAEFPAGFPERGPAAAAAPASWVKKIVPSLPTATRRKTETAAGLEKTTLFQRLFPCLRSESSFYEPAAHCGWHLRFRMLQGKNLRSADIDGSSDPYVVFFGNLLAAPPASRVLGRPSRWRTRTIVKNLNPTWRCDTQVPLLPLLTTDPSVVAKEHLLFRVMDEDTFTMDDPIGYGRLYLGPLAEAALEDCAESASIDTVVPLTQFGRLAGELRLTVTLERAREQTERAIQKAPSRKTARRRASAKSRDDSRAAAA